MKKQTLNRLILGSAVGMLSQLEAKPPVDFSAPVTIAAPQEKKAVPKKKKPVALKRKLSRGVLTPMDPESVAFKMKPAPKELAINQGDSVVIIGSGMASRMNHFPHFETELYLRFPEKNIKIRNMGDEGNTPGFRPTLAVTRMTNTPSLAPKNFCPKNCKPPQARLDILKLRTSG